MNAARAEIFLEGLAQGQLDWLLAAGIRIPALIHPVALTVSRGSIGPAGRFDYDESAAPEWLAFECEEDFVFWRFDRLGEPHAFCTAYGRAFALGDGQIDNAGTYAFNGWLRVWPDPLAWLKHNRDGIVILDWSRVFERLRDCPRILGETIDIGERVDTLMHPPRLPSISARKAKGRR